MLLVYAIILNYNSLKDTIRLFDSIKELEKNKNYRVIPLVIDNTENNLQEHTKLKNKIPESELIINKKNVGYAGGNNIGIRHAINNKADYVFILNPDIKLQDNSLNILINTIENFPKMAAIGPRICFDHKPDKIYSDGGLVYPEKGYIAKHLHHEQNIEEVTPDIYTDIQYVNGSAILIRTEAIMDIGYFNESFFLYYEETDFCLRLKDNNWTIATNPKSIVYHSSSKKGAVFYFYLTRNRIWLARLRRFHIRSAIISILKEMYYDVIRCFKKNKFPNKNLWYQVKGLIFAILFSPKIN